MDKDRIAALIEGINQWRVYESPTPYTMGIRTRTTPWGDTQYYVHGSGGSERVLTWTSPDYVKQLFDRLQGIDPNSKISSPVALSDYIMNEGDE
jgi:hypothetical protein